MREDLDITIQLQLHPLMAWYGVERKIQGFDGRKLWVEVPAGLRNGTRLRLKGEGEKRGDCQGDLYVEIQIKHPKFFLLQKVLAALGSGALGSVLISQLSDSIFYDVWLVLGFLSITLGGIIFAGIISGKCFDKRETGLCAFLFLCGSPALIINGFEVDIVFSWFAAFCCATIGGAVGGLSLCPKPRLSGLIGGILAGNGSLAAVYFYTLHRVTVFSFEIALLLTLGCLPGIGIGWLLKKALSTSLFFGK